MSRIKGLFVPLVFLVITSAVQTACATTRGEFFDISRRPSIQFDKKTLTWILRNQAVERVVHYDAKAGSLKTTVLRDVRHNWSLPVDGTFEGGFTFASPIIGMPTPLTVWRTVTVAPPDGWAKPGFDDSEWSAYEP